MLSYLELAILGLVKEKPRSGYELRRVFATTPMGHFSDSPGAVYAAVGRLVQRALLRPVARERRGRAREDLHLTREGGAELRAALRQPLREEEVLRAPDHEMLRFAFLLAAGEREEALRFLNDYGDITARHASELERHRKQMVADGAGEVVLPLEQGIALYRARARWARASARKLSAGEKS